MRKSVSALAVLSFAFSLSLVRPPAAPKPPNGNALQRQRLTGWNTWPGGITVEDGLMKTHGGMVSRTGAAEKLATANSASFQDARFQRHSGVYVRIPIEPREPWMPVHYGYEVRSTIIPKPPRRRLSHHRRALFLTKPLAKPGKPARMEHMEITLDGPHTVVL